MDKEILREFIQVYKTKQCLWDPKSLHYFNRQMRRIALEDLLIILKKLHPASNIDSVRLKIDILRTNYNRERKKVQRSSEIGKEIYVPSLWYYKELNFLADILKPNAEGLNKEENELDVSRIILFFCIIFTPNIVCLVILLSIFDGRLCLLLLLIASNFMKVHLLVDIDPYRVRTIDLMSAYSFTIMNFIAYEISTVQSQAKRKDGSVADRTIL